MARKRTDHRPVLRRVTAYLLPSEWAWLQARAALEGRTISSSLAAVVSDAQDAEARTVREDIDEIQWLEGALK